MGIEFTGLDAASRLELQTWLERHCSAGEDKSESAQSFRRVSSKCPYGNVLRHHWHSLHSCFVGYATYYVEAIDSRTKHRVSDNVGSVKQFLSNLSRALGEERHFALVEAVLCQPQARS